MPGVSATERVVFPVKLVQFCLPLLSFHLFFISNLKLLIWRSADQVLAPDPTRYGWGEGAYPWMEREQFSEKHVSAWIPQKLSPP